MLGQGLDYLLTRVSKQPVPHRDLVGLVPRFIPTAYGDIRLIDSGGNLPCVMMVPDGPGVIESYAQLIPQLTDHFRVVCFDMPGFGYSYPSVRYDHSLDAGANAVIAVLDALKISDAMLAFSCANGFYAMRVAQMVPDRVRHLVLSQTPSPEAMFAWARKTLHPIVEVPVLGQAVFWAIRQKAAASWFKNAPAKNSNTETFANPALHALAHGSCFCMAGAVQGLRRMNPATFGKVEVPSTLIWGSLDKTHRHTKPQSIVEVIPGAQVIKFSDCGHMPDLEQPQRFAGVLLEQERKNV